MTHLEWWEAPWNVTWSEPQNDWGRGGRYAKKLQDNHVTIVEQTVVLDHGFGSTEVVKVVGSARRNPLDRHDPETGLLLAQARLYEKLAKGLYKQANARIKHADDIRQQHEQRKNDHS